MEVKAMIHSSGKVEKVRIVKNENCNNIIVDYKGKKFTAVYNCFTNLYYVDDKFGVVLDG